MPRGFDHNAANSVQRDIAVAGRMMEADRAAAASRIAANPWVRPIIPGRFPTVVLIGDAFRTTTLRFATGMVAVLLPTTEAAAARLQDT